MTVQAPILPHPIGRDGKSRSRLIEALEKDKKISEDDKFNGLELLQKIIDDYSKKIEEGAAAKEKEILERRALPPPQLAF